MDDLNVLDTAVMITGWPTDILITKIDCWNVFIILLNIALVAQLVYSYSY